MASKSKKRSKRLSVERLFQQLERNLEKGNYKQAVKDAKACHRQAPTDEHRRLLEYASIGRAQELCRQGMRDASRGVVENLLQFGVTDPSVQAALPDLLLSLGLFDRLPADRETAAQDGLRVKAADLAVLRPQETPASMPDIRREALQIRAALESLAEGDDATALSGLKNLARESPFADWKFFVRGLAAYYRQDTDEMTANWQRLDADRLATRIAEPLKAMAGVTPLDPRNARLRASLARLEHRITDRSLLPQLAVLQKHVAQRDWTKVLQALRSVRGPLRQTDAALCQRLSSWLCSQFIREGLQDELERLSRIVDPLPLDPHWNRARALAEDIQCGDLDEDSYHWRKYLLDLENLPALSPSERKLAQAMVWHRLAQPHIKEALGLHHCTCGRSHSEEVAEQIEDATDCLENCLELAPTFALAYEAMAAMYLEVDQPDDAVTVFLRLLQHVPDDFAAVMFLIQHYLQNDEPIKAQEYACRARRLKPLDQEVLQLMWSTHVASARHHARRGQFDQGRAEFAAADALCPDRSNDPDVLARKAVFEIKAGFAEGGRQLVEQALETLPEPTAVWLNLTIEATRYGLPKEDVWYYEKRWTAALKRRCQSETAGRMCRLLLAHLESQQPYRGRSEHVGSVLKYVRRCSRVKWQPDDLRSVCEFLDQREEDTLLAKYVQKGLRKFPQVAYFQWMAGELEIKRGPDRCNRRWARQRLERALELTGESNDPRDRELSDVIKQRLTLLEEATRRDLAGHDRRYEPFEDERFPGSVDEDDIRNMSPQELAGLFEAMCAELGLDPEEALSSYFASDAPTGTVPKRKRAQRRRQK